MLHNLKIFVDKHTSGVSAKTLRGYILSIINTLPQEDQDKICFHLTKEQLSSPTSRKIPYILFGKPHRDCFSLYGYDDEGKRLLNLIKRELRFRLLYISFFNKIKKYITLKNIYFSKRIIKFNKG